MTLLESLKLKLGLPAPDFALKGIDGEMYSLTSFADKKILVIVFMCNHCPYVQAVWSRLNALQEKYKGQAVQFVGINPNVNNPDYAEETFDLMKVYAERYGMNFPYLEDPGQEAAKLYEAQCTPDIYVYDMDRLLAYHGRVDDNWKDETQVTSRELDAALRLLIAGKRPLDEQRPSMGCSIKWR
ncbi:thioredoxin family protein [Candidatus Peregrinibacteria bacterium]|nr:thioredoxin family protein [Candidatus Peregrinibacteria bacterium]